MQKEEFRLEPYRDEEAQAAVTELFAIEAFLNGMQRFLPEQLFEHLKNIPSKIHSIYDFQKEMIYPFLKMIEQVSITKMTTQGLEHFQKDEKYLFISNHRDIVLDSAYLNMLLFEKGIPTSQMAIGDNLIFHRISELLFRLNRSFIVKRTGAPRELYGYSVRLSQYIHDLITGKESSVWIAQREGRAKDGNDTTQAGLLKMVSLAAGKGDLVEHFKKLKIVPVTITYELDPTDIAKTKEFFYKKENPNYKKSFQEDLEHILLGLKGQKGNAHFHYSKPLNEELDILKEAKNNKQRIEQLAQIIDKTIHQQYQFNPINYIAFDILNGLHQFENHYSAEDFEKYNAIFNQKAEQFPEKQQTEAKDYLLKMYSNPLKNSLKNK